MRLPMRTDFTPLTQHLSLFRADHRVPLASGNDPVDPARSNRRDGDAKALDNLVSMCRGACHRAHGDCRSIGFRQACYRRRTGREVARRTAIGLQPRQTETARGAAAVGRDKVGPSPGMPATWALRAAMVHQLWALKVVRTNVRTMAELISAREFASREPCDEKLIRRAIAKGLLQKDSGGFLDAVQIGNGWRKTNRCGSDSAAAQSADTSKVVRTDVRTSVKRVEAQLPGEALMASADRSEAARCSHLRPRQ